jgi:hypothetical protein
LVGFVVIRPVLQFVQEVTGFAGERVQRYVGVGLDLGIVEWVLAVPNSLKVLG